MEQINNGQLAAIVNNLLTNPFSGEVDNKEAFEQFCTDIAQVVCDYCGGKVVTPASYVLEADDEDWTTHYSMEIQPNESSPEDGGVWAKPPEALSPAEASTKSSVPVKYWDCYHSEYATANTHQFDVDDQRKTHGQMYVDIGALEGHVDDMLGITMEINTNPLNGIDHVPCAHVHFDGSNLAVSLFKIGDKILVRPETDVRITAVREKAFDKWPEQMFWIE